VNALRDPRTRLATSAVSQATSLATAKTLLLRVLGEVVDSNLVVVTRSATSARRLDTSPVTARSRVVDMEVDMEANRAGTVEDSVVDNAADRHATPAEDTDTCLVTAPKDRSATTVARLVT